jgi:hypothetical protein
MPGKRASVKNEKQYEGLRKKGMSKERAAKIANTPDASKKGGKKSAKRKSNAKSNGSKSGAKKSTRRGS